MNSHANGSQSAENLKLCKQKVSARTTNVREKKKAGRVKVNTNSQVQPNKEGWADASKGRNSTIVTASKQKREVKKKRKKERKKALYCEFP